VFPEDSLLPLSALQHLLYCPRQCALIHVERLWAENRLTLEGQHLHRQADAAGTSAARETRGSRKKPRDGREHHSRPADASGGRVSRGMPLRSFQLGLSGKADIVEFHPAAPAQSSVPFPVEYKRGKPKKNRCDEVQLCAQALCLEEMLAADVPLGAIFYGRTRRRMDVVFDEGLRRLTLDTVRRLHELIDSGRTPAAVYEKKKCERCSLKSLCLPDASGPSLARASRYLARALADSLSRIEPPDG